jgi:hypothetical protein
MQKTDPGTFEFIISAEDHDLACSVLEMRFIVDDSQQLVDLIPEARSDDPHLWSQFYELEEVAWRRIVTTFAIPFDTAGLKRRKITVCLWRLRWLTRVPPYAIHTGFELLLLLDGRKKLARMGDSYPPMKFKEEDAFDCWVSAGLLHREEVVEPFEKPHRGWQGQRTVYYTQKGEEWRIPAMQLIWEASGKSGGWNETYERLEGMLFGYGDWQNDWWLDEMKRRGRGFSGLALCCTVTAAGLAWIESSGLKALPPIGGDVLALYSFDPDAVDQLNDYLIADPQAIALVRFNIFGRVLIDMIGPKNDGPWRLPAAKIASVNREILGPIEIALRKS